MEYALRTPSSKRLELWILPAILVLIDIAMSFFPDLYWGRTVKPVLYIVAGFSLVPILRYRTRFFWPVMLFSVGIISFGIGEGIWSVLSLFFHQDPVSNIPLQYFYSITNLCILASVVYIFRLYLDQWYIGQLILDIFACMIIFIGTVYFLFFDSPFAGREWIMDPSHYSAFLYLAFDTASMVFVFILSLSEKTRNLNHGFWVMAAAISLFSLADGMYVLEFIHDRYVAGSYIDSIFFAGLLLLVSGIKKTFFINRSKENLADPFRQYKDNPILTTSILVAVVLVDMAVLRIRISALVNFLLVILLYLIVSLLLQKNLASQTILREREKLNENLSILVEMRTRELQDMFEKLQTVHRHEEMSGLYSKSYFGELLEREIAMRHPGQPLYLVLLSLRHFKAINEMNGRKAGDEIIRHMGAYLREAFPQGAHLSCLGGDNFAILLYAVNGAGELDASLRKVSDIFSRPLSVFSFQITADVRMGVSCYPEDAKNSSTLITNAEIALAHAKSRNIRPYFCFDRAILDKMYRKHEVQLTLQNARIDREFALYYQPKYTVDGHALVGMEALARWNSPSLGPVSPGEFIPVAEETGLILDVGNWVMAEAMRQIRLWNSEHHTDYIMSINVSALQLQEPEFLSMVRKNLAETGVNPDWIEFELTESSALTSEILFQSAMSGLSEMGIAVSIDDFGTGYSSLAYLQEFSVKALKIDKRLIDAITVNAKIVKAITAMAHALGIQTVAEGVETAEQADILAKMRCDLIQGYLYGRPVPPEEFLREHLLCDSGHPENLTVRPFSVRP